MTQAPNESSERTVLFIIGAVQCINILDFQMIMPLGPDFTKALGIEASNIGYISGIYTLVAALTGLLIARHLDKFDRKTALIVSLLGLSLSTAACGFAVGLKSMLVTRALAGMFGGPAAALSLTIVGDLIPKERIGRAMGVVLGAFSVASVLGVPFGLQLAVWFNWQMPFWLVTFLGLMTSAIAYRGLPSIVVTSAHKQEPLQPLSNYSAAVYAYIFTFCAFVAGFLIVPNVSQYVQFNLGYPRNWMSFLYAIGGAISFIAMRFIGKGVDRFGSLLMGSLGVVLHVFIVFAAFAQAWPIPVEIIYVVYMLGLAFRNVSMNALFAKIPKPIERARFMSIQSAVQHFASAVGAFLAAKILIANENGKLDGMPTVAYLAVGFTAALVLFYYVITKKTTT